MKTDAIDCMAAHASCQLGLKEKPEHAGWEVFCNTCFMKIGDMPTLGEVLAQKPKRPADMTVLKCPKGHEGPFQIADVVPASTR